MKIIRSRNENNKNSNKIFVWVQSIEIYLFFELSYIMPEISSNLLPLLIPHNSFLKLILIIPHKYDCNSNKNSKHNSFSLQTFHIMNKNKVQIYRSHEF